MKFYNYDPTLEELIKLIGEYPDRIEELELILEDNDSYSEILEDWR